MSKVLVWSQKDRLLEEQLKEMLDSARELDWLKGFEGKSKIIIKPNLCYLAPWESGVTTNVELVDILIRYIREHHPNIPIVIVESDNNDRRCNDAFDELGYTALSEKHGIELLNLTNEPYHEVIIPNLRYTINIPEIFFEEVFIISIAQLKVHLYQKMSCIYKNQFGCVPDEIKERYHQYMEETLYMLNKLIKPDLSIIDGKIGLEGIGPVTGTPIQVDLMLMSDNPTAMDTIAAKIMGFEPRDIPHLQYAFKRDGIDPERYQVEGIERLPDFQFKSDSAFKMVRAKINVTRITDSSNKNLKKFTEKVYGFPTFVKRAYGFGKRKLKGMGGS
jgi:uncharacterized protein (DUF362 family)